ncbi:MAG: hypothetical protein DCC55_17060 [Chloroflexi bacterium]|nr:MAG: hypothetical protein DCC55_17060 [Chloroflexota bacterium]
MLHRKTWALSLVLVLLLVVLAGCGMGTSTAAATCNAVVSVDEALAAQDAGMAGLMTGNVSWTNDQMSSFLTVLLQQNTGPNFPIEQIATCFEPGGKILARIDLGEGVLLGSNTIEAVGSINVQDGHLVVDLDEAAANGFMVAGPVLDAISAQINAALADPSMATIIDVSTDDGSISLGMGGM